MRRAIAATGVGATLLLHGGSARAQGDYPSWEPEYEPTATKPPSGGLGPWVRAGQGYVGADYRRVFDIPIVGGDANLGFSWEAAKSLSLGLTTDLFVGTRGYGLRVWIWNMGFDMAYRLERLRLGGGIGLGCISMDRATEGAAFFSLDLAVWAMASFDVWHWGNATHQALFVGARLESAIAGNTTVWGPSAGVGIRF